MKQRILFVWLASVVALWFSPALQAAVVDNLEAYWKLDETSGTTANDSSVGGLYDGTISGGVTQNQAGIIGKAYDFDEATDGLVATATAPTIAQQFTVGGWVRPDMTRSGTTSSSRSAIIGTDNNHIMLAIGEAGTANNPAKVITYDGATTAKTATMISPGNWYHIVFTRNGSTLNTYVDGMLVQSFNTGAGDSDIGILQLGRYSTQTARDWDGLMDDMGVWSAEKSAEEIALIHGLGLLAAVALDDSAIDDVLAVFNAASGSANAGAYVWSYATGQSTTTIGEITGSTGGLDAFIALDGNGNGVQITGLVPEPASVLLLGLGASLLLVGRKR